MVICLVTFEPYRETLDIEPQTRRLEGVCTSAFPVHVVSDPILGLSWLRLHGCLDVLMLRPCAGYLGISPAPVDVCMPS